MIGVETCAYGSGLASFWGLVVYCYRTVQALAHTYRLCCLKERRDRCLRQTLSFEWYT